MVRAALIRNSSRKKHNIRKGSKKFYKIMRVLLRQMLGDF